ncbi:hypothetical protein MNBD_GAMMA11-971 [hydrothermal vent metagenome]|uniref:Uncharacterized protein n=1 Tax=hydrothermal vent metagenome TaxID=652676 RepID=A0A3B0X1G9_9ZZZZ
MGEKQMTLKRRFLDAICTGELGEEDDHGVVVKLKDFKRHFSDVRTDYINSFLPAAVIEIGQYSPTHTKYVFRISKGVYRVHVDAIMQYKAEMYSIPGDASNHKIEEAYIHYQYSVMI